MTNVEATITENAATVAEQGAHVAPEKASSKKGASPKNGAPKGQKAAKGGKKKLEKLWRALEDTGASLHAYTDPVVKYHAKYLVADDGPSIVASLNFTKKCFKKTWDALSNDEKKIVQDSAKEGMTSSLRLTSVKLSKTKPPTCALVDLKSTSGLFAASKALIFAWL